MKRSRRARCLARQAAARRKAVQDEGEAALPRFVFEDGRHVVVGIARMDHQRQAGLARGRDMRAKASLPALRAATGRRNSRGPASPIATTLGCAESRTSSSAVTSGFFRRIVRMRADRAIDRVDSSPRFQGFAQSASRASKSSPCARCRRPGRARRPSSRSSAKSGKSRWQWLSTSMRYFAARPVRHSAGNTGCGAGSAVPETSALPCVRHGRKSRWSSGTARRSSSLAAEPGMYGWQRMRDPSNRLGGRVQHRFHALRIGLLQRPGLLRREIAVGFRHHAEYRGERQMDRLAPPSPCAPSRARRLPGRASRVGSWIAPRFGTRPPQFLAIIDSERCARLPRSLARSALVRLTIASWL